MHDQKKEQILFAVSVVLLFGLYTVGLFFNITGDAAKYAYIAKNITESNDWVNLKIMGEPYLQKPQFLFWLSAVSFKFLGISNFTFKLPIFLYSLLGFFASYKLGSCLFDKKIGMMATTMLAFSTISIIYNADIHTDIVLQTNVMLSMWLLFEFLSKRKLIYLIFGAFFVGLSILTKGPFGAMVPFFAVLGYLIAKKDYKYLYNPRWILFFIIVGITIIPAILPLVQNRGLSGLWFFVWENNIGRATGSYMGTNYDPLYYLHSFAYLLLPWTIVVGAGIYFQFKKFIRTQLLSQEHFLFWGIWIVFILLSISRSKLQNYAQVLVPLLFIQTANAWQHYFMRIKNPWKRSHEILMMVIWVLITIFPLLLNVKQGIPYVAILVFLGLISVAATRSLLPSKKLYYNTLSLLLGMAFVANGFLLPRLLKVQAEEAAAKIIQQEIEEGETVYNYNLKSIERKQKALLSKEKITSFDKTPNIQHFYLNYELMFYSSETIHNIDNQSELDNVLRLPGAWIFTDLKGKNDIFKKSNQIKSIYELAHFNLRQPAHSINWKERSINFDKMYLIHLSDQI